MMKNLLTYASLLGIIRIANCWLIYCNWWIAGKICIDDCGCRVSESRVWESSCGSGCYPFRVKNLIFLNFPLNYYVSNNSCIFLHRLQAWRLKVKCNVIRIRREDLSCQNVYCNFDSMAFAIFFTGTQVFLKHVYTPIIRRVNSFDFFTKKINSFIPKLISSFTLSNDQTVCFSLSKKEKKNIWCV